jgi:3-phenylpropionate/trans-cinnamate dioxygenase ferredoxin subunit
MPWIDACATDDIDKEDVIPFALGAKSFAIYHGIDGNYYCTDGICTHEHAHLSDGLVMNFEIECPMHSGLFDYRSGKAKRAPACVDLRTYATKVEDGRVMVDLP